VAPQRPPSPAPRVTPPSLRPHSSAPLPRALLRFALLWALALVVHARALPGGYLADDYFLVAQRADGPADVAWRTLPAVFFEPPPTQGEPLFHRPVWRASYVLDVWWSELGAPASRVFGLGLHAACGALLLAWLCSLGARRGAAWFAALLWIVFPVSTEGVLWIAARCDQLAAVGSLGALLARARALERGGSRGLSALALVALTVGLWSKENAAAAGLVLLAQEGLHPARSALTWRARARAALPFLGALAVLALALGALRWSVLGTLVGGYRGEPLDPWKLWTSLSRNTCSLLFPFTWAFDLPLSAARSEQVLAGAGAAALALLCWPRSGAPAKLLCVWLPAQLLCLAGLRVDDPAHFHTRFLYLASLGWCALLALGCAALVGERRAGQRPLRRSLGQAAGVGLALAALAALGPRVEDFRAMSLEMQRLGVAARAAEREHAGGLLLLDVPVGQGVALAAHNAFAWILLPPHGAPMGNAFRTAAVLDSELDGADLGFDRTQLLLDQRVVRLRWDGERLSPTDTLGYRGERLPLLPAEVTFDRTRNLPSGLVVEGATPGSGALLLYGREAGQLDLGRAGWLGIAEPRQRRVGTADATGKLELQAAELDGLWNRQNPLLVQVLVHGPEGLRLSELRTLAPRAR
jgi:hypothetical protein